MRAATLALALAAAPLGGPAFAQTAPAPAEALTGTRLEIAAEETRSVAPDRAIVTLGVIAQGATAQAASAENAKLMTGVMQSLRRARIAERDVQTANLTLEPQYRYADNEPPQLIGYQANNTVNIVVRDLSQLGRVMDAAVAAGGNQVQGVQFLVQDQETPLNEARRAALAKARARAEMYAGAAGMQVARIVSIAESSNYVMPQPVAMARMSVAEDAATPVSPGEIPLTAMVNVVFELR